MDGCDNKKKMSSDKGKDDDIEINYESEVTRKKSRKIKSQSSPKVEQQEEDAISEDQSNDPVPPIQQQRRIVRQKQQQQQQQRYHQQMQFFQPPMYYPMPYQQGPYSPAIYYPQQQHHQQQQQCCRFCNNGRVPPPCPPPIQIPMPMPLPPPPPTKNIIRIIKESDGGRRRRCCNDSERSLLNHQSCCSPPQQQKFYHIGNNAGTSRVEYCSFPPTDRDYCSVVDSTEFCPVPQPTKSNKVRECCIIPKSNEDSLLQCCPSPPNNSSKYPKCFISQQPDCCFINPPCQQQQEPKDGKRMIATGSSDQGSQCSPPTDRCEESTQYNPPPKYRECECQCECDEIKTICCPLPPTKSKYRNKTQKKQIVITTNTCECQTDQNPLICCSNVDPCCIEENEDKSCKEILDDFCNRCCSANAEEDECIEEEDDCLPETEPVQTQTDNEWPVPRPPQRKAQKTCPENKDKYPIQPILKKMLECHDTVKVDAMNLEICTTKAPPAAYYGEPYGFRKINTSTGELVRRERNEPERNPPMSQNPKCVAQTQPQPHQSVSSGPSESPPQSPPRTPSPEKVPSRQTIKVQTTSSITTLSGTPSKGVEVQTQTTTDVKVGSDVEFHKKVPSKPIQIQTESGPIVSPSSGNYVLSPPPASTPSRTSSLVPEPRKSSSIAVKTDSNTVVKSRSSVVKSSSHTSVVSNPSSHTPSQTEPPRVTSSPVPTHSSYTIPIAELPNSGGTITVRVTSSGIDGGVPSVTVIPSGEIKQASQTSQTSPPVSPSQLPECQPLPQCPPDPECEPIPECDPTPPPAAGGSRIQSSSSGVGRKTSSAQPVVVSTHSVAPEQIQVQMPGCTEPVTYTRTDCVTVQPSQPFEIDEPPPSPEPSPPPSPPRKESSEEVIQTSAIGTQVDAEPESKPERLSLYKLRRKDPCDKRPTYVPSCENDRYGRGIYPTISPIKFCCDEDFPHFRHINSNAANKKRYRRPFGGPIPNSNSGTINPNPNREISSEFDADECYDAAGNRKPRLPQPQPLPYGTDDDVGGSNSGVPGGGSSSGSGVGRNSSGVYHTQSHESVISPRLRRLSQPRNPVQLNSANKEPQCPPIYNIFPNSRRPGIITRPYSRPFKTGMLEKCYEFK